MFGLSNVQSLTGLGFTLAVCWALSEDRRRFPWKLALGAVALQVALVLLLFGNPAARAVLAGIAGAVNALANSAQAGTEFVFGFLAGGQQPYQMANGQTPPYILAFRVLPVILMICALSALLWHWKILKWITQGFGLLFQKTLGLRGPPGLATAATIFMGQIEGPIFIRAYLDRLTRSELFMLLSVGMSCVSGSTMVAYAAILERALPNAAAHVFTASIISAPAGVLLSRIMIPPDPKEADEGFDMGQERHYDSSIDALIRGVGDGLTVVLNVGATLIVFVGLIFLADRLFAVAPSIGGRPVSIERMLGMLLAPLAWMLGIPWRDAPAAGSLLGVKLVLTEFSAFTQLGNLPPDVLLPRSRMIMTYALCGFANLASVGINVAGYGTLVPQRRAEVMAMVWKAMTVGFLATCMTASIVAALPGGLFVLG